MSPKEAEQERRVSKEEIRMIQRVEGEGVRRRKPHFKPFAN